MSNPEKMRSMTDADLDRAMMDKDLNEYGHQLAIAEANRRSLEKSIRRNFLPAWTGWMILAASLIAAAASVIGLFCK